MRRGNILFRLVELFVCAGSCLRIHSRFPHPKFKKVVTGYSKFYAHDEKAEAKIGDVVLIEETRPLSKLKRWRLTKVLERSSGVAPVAA